MALRVGSKINLEGEEYEIGEHIGSGGFANVHEVVGGDKPLVVKEYWMRKYLRFSDQIENGLVLRRALAARCGEGVADLSSDVFSFPRADYLVNGQKFLLMDRLPGREVYGVIDEIIDRRPAFVVDFLRKMVAGVAPMIGCLIDNGMVHRDIKPSNLVFDDNVFRLFDFDTLALKGREQFNFDWLIGTPILMPPEAFKDTTKISETFDVFSLAFIVFSELRCVNRAIYDCVNQLGLGILEAGDGDDYGIRSMMLVRAFSRLTADPEAQRKLRAAVLEVEDVGTLREDIHGLVEFGIAALQPNPADRPRTIANMMQLLNSKPNNC